MIFQIVFNGFKSIHPFENGDVMSYRTDSSLWSIPLLENPAVQAKPHWVNEAQDITVPSKRYQTSPKVLIQQFYLENHADLERKSLDTW